MYRKRREQLLDQLDGDVLIVPAARAAIRNNDVEHDYRQSSDFYYLTGFEEPESLLLLGGGHERHRHVLFLRPRDAEKERWDGERLGVDRALEELEVDAAFPIQELASKLPEYLNGARAVHVRLGEDAALDKQLLAQTANLRRRNRKGVVAPNRFVDVSELLHEMRLRKSAEELTVMRRAAEITEAAHTAAMSLAGPGVFEYQVEAELMRVFRAQGSARAAYGSIVGAGNNATVLHYRQNNRQMLDGDLLLIDAGCEWGYYASDVTRTFPVNGRFTGPQRAIYELVLAAQEAACTTVAPSRTLSEVHDSAVSVLVDGLLDLGLLEGSRDQAMEEKSYRAYYMHQTSHWLGMDVHDVGAYTSAGEPRTLEPGMVLTVEPGLYVSEDADVPGGAERFRGIGVRIEDDLVVTSEGHENLTATIPKSIDEVEAAVRAG